MSGSDAIILILILICIGVWALVFTIKSSVKRAVDVLRYSGVAQDSTLNNILKEIERLGIRRKSDEEIMAEAEERADRRLLKK